MNKVIWRYKWRDKYYEIHETDWGYHFYYNEEWLYDERKGKYENEREAIEEFRILNAIPRSALEEGKING